MNSTGNLGSGFQSGQQQKRILVKDDEQDVIITLRMALEQNGFKTDSYTNPVLAYKNFRDGLYDLVILDIKMPAVDGFLLHQKIRKTDRRVKICFLTASELYHEQVRKEQVFDGFNQESFLRKPVKINELVDITERLLDSG